MYPCTRILPSFLVLVALNADPIQAQSATAEWHPALKDVWEDAETWDLVTPDDLDINPERFAGLRTVYHREWRLLRDNPRGEDVNFQFERGMWRGSPVLTVRFYAAGVPHDTTSGKPGWFNGIVEPRSMRMVNLSSGGPWGYTVDQTTDSGTVQWRLPPRTTDEWVGPVVTDGHGPVFFDALLGQIFSGIEVVEGMKFRIATLGSGEVTITAYRVAGRTRIEDLRGERHEVWAVETPQGRSGWVTTYFVSDRAPYYFGYESKHVESGDVRSRMWLKGFQRLEN